MKAVADGLFLDVSVGCHPKPSSDGAGSDRSALQRVACNVVVLVLCGASRAPRPGSGFHTSSSQKALPQPQDDRMGAGKSCSNLLEPYTLLKPGQSSSSVHKVKMTSWRHGCLVACWDFAWAYKAFLVTTVHSLRTSVTHAKHCLGQNYLIGVLQGGYFQVCFFQYFGFFPHLQRKTGKVRAPVFAVTAKAGKLSRRPQSVEGHSR